MSESPGLLRETAVCQLAERLHCRSHFAAEVMRARREFFGVQATQPQPAAAEVRFQEWLMLERDSELLGAVPASMPEHGLLELQQQSLVGVFSVRSVNGGEVLVQDLQDQDLLDLVVPAGTLQPGDLVVGRLYGSRAGLLPSSAAAIFRPGEQIGAAFQHDVAQLELGRRLQQVELEHLLLSRYQRSETAAAADMQVPIERLEADLEAALVAGGASVSATDLSQQLRQCERPGQVLGPVLEQLAFATTVDLDRVRRLLLELWNAWLRAEPAKPEATAASSTSADQPLGAQLVQRLEDGLKRHQDIDELFASLERMAGLEPGTADEDETSAAPTAQDGELASLVDEYLWEEQREAAPGAPALRAWPQLLANAALPHLDIEQITSSDVTRLLLHVFLSAGETSQGRAVAVHAAFAELQRFSRWLTGAQELSLEQALQAKELPMVEHADRLAAAGAALSAPGHGEVVFLRVVDLDNEGIRRGFGCVDDEGEHRWFASQASGQLQHGDLVLGAVQGERFVGPVVVLPASVRELLE